MNRVHFGRRRSVTKVPRVRKRIAVIIETLVGAKFDRQPDRDKRVLAGLKNCDGSVVSCRRCADKRRKTARRGVKYYLVFNYWESSERTRPFPFSRLIRIHFAKRSYVAELRLDFTRGSGVRHHHAESPAGRVSEDRHPELRTVCRGR